MWKIGQEMGLDSRKRSAAAHLELSSSPEATMSASWRARSSLESSHAITRDGTKRTRLPTRTVGSPSLRRRGIWRSEHPRNFARSFVVQSGATEVLSGGVVVAIALQSVSTKGRESVLPGRERVNSRQKIQRMKTSRAPLDRILDPGKPSLTVASLGKAAAALCKKVELRFVPA